MHSSWFDPVKLPPWWPTPTGPFNPNTVARHAGDMHGALMKQILQSVERAKTDPAQAMRDDLHQLHNIELVSAHDMEQLGLVISAITSEQAPSKTLMQVDQFLDQLLAQGETASPVAVAIANIALNSVKSIQSGGAMEDKPKVPQSDVAGAIGGALGGAIGGGLGGAVIGAIVGGAVASALLG